MLVVLAYDIMKSNFWLIQGSSPHIPEPDYDLSDDAENGSYSGSEGSWRGDPQQGGDPAWRDTATLRYIDCFSVCLSICLFLSLPFSVALFLSLFQTWNLKLFEQDS